MKSFIRISLALMLSCFITQSAISQGLLKDIKRKAQKNIEERLEDRAADRAGKEVDKQLDKVEEAIFNDEEESPKNSENKGTSNNRSEERVSNIMKKMGVGGEPVSVENSYSFDNLVQMHIESFDEKGKKISDGEFITHLSNDSKSMAYEFVSGDMAQPGMGFIIIDANNSATIILSEENGQKTGLVYGLGNLFQTAAAAESVDEIDFSETPDTYLANPNVEKTGRSKTIAGLHCEEYKYTDENTVSNIWITKDLKMNTQDFFGTLFKTAIYSHGMGWGYMMEATTVNKENGEKSVMEVTKVDKNSHKKVMMSDYQVTNIGSFGTPAKE